MSVPNLAAKPRLNTRPVWVVTGIAVIIGLVLTAVNVRLYLSSNQTLEAQLNQRDQLQARRDALASEFSANSRVLDGVPWNTLRGRVESVNEVLTEHSFSWALFLNRVADVLPWQVRIISVSPSPHENGVLLSIDAVSKDRDGFLDLLDRMVEDPYFEDPRPSREEWPEGGGTTEYAFSMRVNYLPEGGVEP